MKKLSNEQKYHRKRILQISHEAKSSHLGSCLSVIDIISAIYKTKKKNEIFVLSAGHAAVALYVILEQHNFMKNPNLKSLHIHPDRDTNQGIYVSTGSLGQGLPIAVGIALAVREKKDNVYCIISDGECAEGSIWEAIRIAAEQKLSNLKIVVNANGFGAYGKINTHTLIPGFKAFGCAVYKVNGHSPYSLAKKLKIKTNHKPLILLASTAVEQFYFLKGQDAHYRIMDDEEYKNAIKQLAHSTSSGLMLRKPKH